jgi:nucleoside-diphosphate-sugar epimerase
VKALVTGAAGFLGRHFVNALTACRWDVTSVDLQPTQVTWDLTGPAHLHVIQDVLAFFDRDTVTYDLIVHCAAAEPHRAAIDGKPMLLAANLQLDAAMFDWAARTGTRVLYISSSAAYPVAMQSTAAAGRRLREEDITWGQAVGRPDANYGWCKLTGELLARNAAETGLPVHVVRPFSGYGEDQSLNFPFPAIVDRARRGDLTVWGPPGQTRDWVHVSDVVAGALAVVDADERRPVNLCTGRAVEMGQLALAVAVQAGQPGPPVTYLEDKPTGVHYRVGDPRRMRLHYRPKVSLEEGIARALAR